MEGHDGAAPTALHLDLAVDKESLEEELVAGGASVLMKKHVVIIPDGERQSSATQKSRTVRGSHFLSCVELSDSLSRNSIFADIAGIHAELFHE